jgi:hypothetical protein
METTKQETTTRLSERETEQAGEMGLLVLLALALGVFLAAAGASIGGAIAAIHFAGEAIRQLISVVR